MYKPTIRYRYYIVNTRSDEVVAGYDFISDALRMLPTFGPMHEVTYHDGRPLTKGDVTRWTKPQIP